jgi:hypothetical protein
MRTSYKQQAAAIKKAIKAREDKFTLTYGKKRLDEFRARDNQWIALNDAYSTLTALRINESLSKSDNSFGGASIGN